MYKKAGYLTEPIKLFYVADKRLRTYPFHYHDFDKIMLFFQGGVTYDMEGTSYVLQPYDIVIVPAGHLHRPVVSGKQVYERLIAYISKEYVASYSRRGCDLSPIFRTASPILRQPQEGGNIYGASCRLRQACSDPAYAGCAALQEALFSELLIYISRAVREHHMGYGGISRQNGKVLQLLSYINGSLTEDLSIPKLAAMLCLSPDYLMHLFKNETGWSLGKYITVKRLLLARDLARQGRPLTEACYDSGFKQYSSFYRAWKKYFGTTPKQGGALWPDSAPME